MKTDFVLDPELAAATLAITTLGLSRLLLMNDARFPWCILVPEIPDLTEWHHLPRRWRGELSNEIDSVSAALEKLPETDKLNVGSLGNRVPQLHIHLVARHTADPAWPGPVWGFGEVETYTPGAAEQLIGHLKKYL